MLVVQVHLLTQEMEAMVVEQEAVAVQLQLGKVIQQVEQVEQEHLTQF
jgi:hypothetical protein